MTLGKQVCEAGTQLTHLLTGNLKRCILQNSLGPSSDAYSK